MGLNQPDSIGRIAARLGIPLRKAEGVQAVRLVDCSRVIDECEAGGALILGMDVLRTAGVSFQATHLVADYSSLESQPWQRACEVAAQSARQFLARIDAIEDLWVEFTLKDRSPR